MKKLFNLILVATMGVTTVFGATTTGVFEPTKIYANTNGITVKVDGRTVVFDEQPMIENGSVFVPMRAIFEALGYEVKWVAEFKAIEANTQKENYLISMALYGGNQMIVTYNEFRSDYKVNSRSDYRNPSDCSTDFTNKTTFTPDYKSINGRILVPVRAISEATGATVTWDGATKTVLIDSTNPIITNVETGVSYDVNGAKSRVDAYFNNSPISNNSTDTAIVNTTVANEILDLVNIERKKAGVSPMTLSEEVSLVAQTKSDDMVKNNYFSHTSPTYGSPFDMLRNFDVSYSTAGENIAEGQRTAEAVMESWMNSDGHKENILNPKFKELGVGYSKSNGRPTWVQIFIGN